MIQNFENTRECSYVEAHNWIYGSIELARQGGIEPHKSFEITQYMLEDDENEDIPIIEYDFGRNGEHFLVCNNTDELQHYLPTLRKHLGDDVKYTAMVSTESYEADEFSDDDILNLAKKQNTNINTQNTSKNWS